MKKRLVSIFLACIMAVTAMSGCTKKGNNDDLSKGATASKENLYYNEKGYPIVKDKISISIMLPKSTLAGSSEDQLYWKKIEELSNIDIKFIQVDESAWAEKKNLSLASGDYPDLFWSSISTLDMYNYGVEGGVFVDYTDLIPKYMPNLQKYFSENPDKKNLLKAYDNKIYGLPSISDTATMAEATLSYRTDMAEKIGINKAPKTVDEFYDMLAKFKANSGSFAEGFVPLIIGVKDRLETALFPAFGESADKDYTLSKGKVTYSKISEQYRRYLEFASKLYKNKLLDQDIFSGTSDQFNARVKANKCAVTDRPTLFTKENFPDSVYKMQMLIGLTSSYNSKPHFRTYNSISLGFGVMTKKNKYPEATARLLDINYSTEVIGNSGLNSLSPWLGIKGENWDLVGENEYKRILPEDTTLSELEYSYKYVAPGSGPCRLEFFKIPTNSEGNMSQNWYAKQSLENIYPVMEPRFPDGYLTYSKDESAVMATKMTDIDNYVKQMTAKFITGFEPLSKWDQYVSDVKKMGIEEVMAVKQAAYDRMNK